MKPPVAVEESTKIKDSIRLHFASSAAVLLQTGDLCCDLILDVASKIAASLLCGGKVLTCGNGGSSADAEHIAAEFVCRLRRERQALPAISLTSNAAALTAIGNDYGFEEIFARQVAAYGQPDDILIAISTSGKSPNVLAALRTAKDRGLRTVVFCGSRMEGAAMLAENVFAVPSTVTAEIQQCHMSIAHAICETVDELLSQTAD